jgi:hypothetical protein
MNADGKKVRRIESASFGVSTAHVASKRVARPRSRGQKYRQWLQEQPRVYGKNYSDGTIVEYGALGSSNSQEQGADVE